MKPLLLTKLMTDQHLITPPYELVQQWRRGGLADAAANNAYERHIATQAARWGANQELEACCEWLDFYAAASEARDLRAARRPKPPSLKEQAYAALDTYVYGEPDPKDKERTYNTIRKALEQLND
jgi:hypothetical protein